MPCNFFLIARHDVAGIGTAVNKPLLCGSKELGEGKHSIIRSLS